MLKKKKNQRNEIRKKLTTANKRGSITHEINGGLKMLNTIGLK